MGVPALAFGRNEDEYITIGPTKEKESVRPFVCKNCGAPLTRGADQCEYCGTVYGPVAELTKKEEENNDLFDVKNLC